MGIFNLFGGSTSVASIEQYLENGAVVIDVRTIEEFESVAKEQMDLIKRISEHISGITSKTNAMVEERKRANKTDGEEKKADLYCKKVKPFFEEIRYHCDKLELMIDDELWPLVKYREMLFTR